MISAESCMITKTIIGNAITNNKNLMMKKGYVAHTSAHKAECRSESKYASSTNKKHDLYYKPKLTDGYLVKKTNRIQWDSMNR